LLAGVVEAAAPSTGEKSESEKVVESDIIINPVTNCYEAYYQHAH
jgi:hypothetical protein